MKLLKIASMAVTLIVVACLLVGYGTAEYTMINKTHTVVAGETLWEIATFYMPEQDKVRRVDEMVWNIRQANKLNTAFIYPGQVLVIPLESRR